MTELKLRADAPPTTKLSDALEVALDLCDRLGGLVDREFDDDAGYAPWPVYRECVRLLREASWDHCRTTSIECTRMSLEALPAEWAGYRLGNWPPHTEGFQLRAPAPSCERHRIEEIGRDIYWCPTCGAINRSVDGVWRSPKVLS